MYMRLTAKILIVVTLMMLVTASVMTAAPGDLANPAQFTAKAPDTFKAKFDTSKGEFTVEVTRAWSPNGADRFYNLVKNGFYNDCRFFRVVENFMVQFGINGTPKVSIAWYNAKIKDDPVVQSNKRGYITFAKSSNPDSRTTQVFINFKDNAFLDQSGFSPFGKVTKGMDVVDSLYNGYGDGAPRGKGPDQGRIINEGNTYLNASFPKMDYIKTATIVE
jgi:peptidyl-prolyl cis-trans isomerase A (cyclophilin A)